MKTLVLKLNDKKYNLRLNAGGQKKLKEKFEQDTLSVLLGAISDIDYLTEVLEVALNFKGNENEVTDGEEFYDMLVDNGSCGSEDFAKIVTDIAVASGIITKDQANALLKTVTKTYNNVFEKLDEVMEENEGE